LQNNRTFAARLIEIILQNSCPVFDDYYELFDVKEGDVLDLAPKNELQFCKNQYTPLVEYQAGYIDLCILKYKLFYI
jgi:hypothetical protein